MRVFVAGATGVLGRRAAGAGPGVAGSAAGQDHAVVMMTQGRGFSNAKAKRELSWQLRYPSWRQGFKEELA